MRYAVWMKNWGGSILISKNFQNEEEAIAFCSSLRKFMGMGDKRTLWDRCLSKSIVKDYSSD